MLNSLLFKICKCNSNNNNKYVLTDTVASCVGSNPWRDVDISKGLIYGGGDLKFY